MSNDAATRQPQETLIEAAALAAASAPWWRFSRTNPAPLPDGVIRRVNPFPQRLESWEACLLAVTLPVMTRVAIHLLPAAVKDQLITVILVLPLILSAYEGGLGAGLIAADVPCLLCAYSLIEPRYSFEIGTSMNGWRVALLALTCPLLSGFHEWLHRTRLRSLVDSRGPRRFERDLIGM